MRNPFLIPGTSKATILNGLTVKKVDQQNSFLSQALGGAVSNIVTANHVGQTAVLSSSTTEGTIADPPPFTSTMKNKVKLFISTTKNTVEYDPGTGAREVYGRLAYSGGVWTLYYFYLSDAGTETAYSLPAGTYDYWYVVRTNLRDVVEDFAISDIRELPIDADKYAPDRIVATDGTGTDTTIAGAITNCPVGGTIFVKNGDYSAEGVITVGKSLALILSDGSIVQQFTVTSDYVTIDGGSITTLNCSGTRNYIRIHKTVTTTFTSSTLVYSEISANRFSTATMVSLSNGLFIENDISGATQITLLLTQSRVSENRFAGNFTIGTFVASVVQCNTYFGASLLITTIQASAGVVIEENTCVAITIGTISNAFPPTVVLISGNALSGSLTITTLDAQTVITGNKASSITVTTMNNNLRAIGNEATVTVTNYSSGIGYFAFNNAVTLPAPKNHNLVDVYNGGQRNGFPIYASDPGSPVEGDTWYNSTDKQFKGYDGTAVIIIG